MALNVNLMFIHMSDHFGLYARGKCLLLCFVFVCALHLPLYLQGVLTTD